jgi:acyl phosphate:glycerol-3-phosphate acyltransferase
MSQEAVFIWVLLAGAYLCGSIPFGVIVARTRNVDVRKVGSGNIGATNVTRAVGKKLGALVLFLDAAKGALPMVATSFLCRAGVLDPLAVPAVGLAAVAGHCFPVWLRFHGGKGVATALGVFLVLDPLSAGVAVAVFAAAFALTRAASVGSLAAALGFVAALAARGYEPGVLLLAGEIAAIIFWRHRDNIQRLRQGNERRFT